MKLQAKIGCGFGILVATCLGLTIGSWFGVNGLDAGQLRRNSQEELRSVLQRDVIANLLLEEKQLSAGGTEFSDSLANAYEPLKSCAQSQQAEMDVSMCREVLSSLSSLQSGQQDRTVRLLGVENVRKRVEKFISSRLAPAIEEQRDEIATLSLWIKRIAVFLSIVGTLVGIGISWFTYRMITRPINITIEKVKEIATGNLAITVPVLTSDEIGSLARAMNSMTGGLKAMFTNIRENSVQLNSASFRLAELSGGMTEKSRRVNDDTENAGRDAEKLSANMNSVAAAMDESTRNINAMVAAIEEMSATISEISRDSENGSSITESAVKEAQVASQTVAELGQAANEINKVTETITEIADQTNLLALNATIEAARAGEAGKGFAVVAHEIKELAAQTTSATKEIRQRIDGVQVSSQQVVHVMGSIIKTISRVNDIVVGITHSVNEQAQASGEISGNVHQASVGMNTANDNVAEASELNRLMTGDLATVCQQVTELLGQCEEVARMADEQKRIADGLEGHSARFQLD